MNILSKEIIKALEPAEEYFRQVKNGFKRNSPHALDVKVYEALKSVNPNEPKPNYSCSKCIFELYRKCSKVHNESKEFYKNEQSEQTEPKPAKPRYKPRATQKENKVKGKKGSSNK